MTHHRRQDVKMFSGYESLSSPWVALASPRNGRPLCTRGLDPRDLKTALFYISFLRKGEALVYVGLPQNLKDLKDQGMESRVAGVAARVGIGGWVRPSADRLRAPLGSGPHPVYRGTSLIRNSPPP